MNYNLELLDRPFKAIRAGTKKIETRVPTSYDKTPYADLKAGDTFTLTNMTTNERNIKRIYRSLGFMELR